MDKVQHANFRRTWSPLSSYKMTLQQQLNGKKKKRWKMRWRANPLIFLGWAMSSIRSINIIILSNSNQPWRLGLYF